MGKRGFLGKATPTPTIPDDAVKLFRDESLRLTLTMLSKQPCVNTFATFAQKPSTRVALGHKPSNLSTLFHT